MDVMWRDDQLWLIRLQHAPPESFEEYPTWRSEGATEAARAGDAFLLIYAPNNFLFKDLRTRIQLELAQFLTPG